jgi:hypothetical protein
VTALVRYGDDLVRLLASMPARAWNDEDALQLHVHEHLTAAGVDCAREYWLSDQKSRVDIFIPTPPLKHHRIPRGIAIEIKVKGGTSEVLRQLTRYADCDEVLDLALITTRAIHANLPRHIDYKPLTVIPLLEGGL